jgi:hypothetical protein
VLLHKGKADKLKAWVPFNGTPAMLVTLSKKAGTGAMGSCIFPSCMVKGIKSKDLFVKKTLAELEVKAANK